MEQGAVDQLNEALLAKANAAKVVKLDKVRADTTVVPANVAYPTDSGLLTKGVAKLTKTVGAIKAAGLARRTAFGTAPDRCADGPIRSRRGCAGAAARPKTRCSTSPASWPPSPRRPSKRPRSWPKRPPGAAPGRRGSLGQGHRPRRGARAHDLGARTVVAQTRTRLGGEVPDGSTRIVSLHDTDARPIAKGRLGRPVEFGFKAQVADNTDGIVLDHCVEMGNPPDAPMLAPAIGRIKKGSPRCPEPSPPTGAMARPRWRPSSTRSASTRRHPAEGTPRCARQGVESSRRFRKLVKWRTGSEGRISYLKHSWGWERTMIDGIDGARTWCGWGVLAHNATKIAVLIDEREQDNSPAPSPTQRPRTSTGPPGRPPPPPPAHPPDLAPTLSRRAPEPETAGKWGQKRPERSERELVGTRGGHSGQPGNRTGSTFSGRSN